MATPGVVSSISFDEIENSKENIKPLKQGRSTENLKQSIQLLEKGKKERESELRTKRKEFEQKISDYQGDDPLVPWLNYIVWTQQTFTNGDPQSELLRLLEKCTRTFKDDQRYKNSEKYLKVWIMYADICEDPEDIFSFLQQRDIGQDLALFYLARALALEHKGQLSKADGVLDNAILRKAQPVDRLKRARAALQLRMAKRSRQRAQQEDQDPVPAAQAPRRALSGLTRHTTGGHRGQGFMRRPTSTRAPAVLALGGSRLPAARRPMGTGSGPASAHRSRALAAKSTRKPAANSSGFTIFDENAPTNPKPKSKPSTKRPGRSHKKPKPKGSGVGIQIWEDLAPRKERNKENKMKASTWVEHGPLHAARRATSSASAQHSQPAPTPAFPVFIDQKCFEEIQRKQREEDEAKLLQAREARVHAELHGMGPGCQGSSVRRRLEHAPAQPQALQPKSPSQDESFQLRQDPTKNMH